jgi:acetyl-CoA synthetase (ADP-forming)
MLGIGGIFTEALSDVAFAAAPLAHEDAADLVDALRLRRVLEAFRGEPAVDRAELVRILEALGEIGARRPDVRSIDINPLIVCDGRPVVVDALVEIEEAGS